MLESAEIDETSQGAAESAAKLRRNIQMGRIFWYILLAAIIIGFVWKAVRGKMQHDKRK